jgi:hypothetical protein
MGMMPLRITTFFRAHKHQVYSILFNLHSTTFKTRKEINDQAFPIAI